jgi:hypothetical protein
MMSNVSSNVSICSGIDCPLKASVKRPTTMKNMADLSRKTVHAESVQRVVVSESGDAAKPSHGRGKEPIDIHVMRR